RLGYTDSGITRLLSYETHDEFKTRVALVHRPEKTIICISTQIGCTGTCKFCSAGPMAVVRGLSRFEMLHIVCDTLFYIPASHPVLVSFMGTGEPLANAEEVRQAIQLMRGIRTPGLLSFALSTSGVFLPELERFPHDVKVQFSLISPIPSVLKELVPQADRIGNILVALCHYPGPKEINTPLIEGVNNDHSTMRTLGAVAQCCGVSVKLNRFHPVNTQYAAAGNEEQCLAWLQRTGAEAELYATDGEDIMAACGQFELR
ncbi:hypothetical protein LCGC14_2758420, partial [marine sediment metagenome]